MVTKILRKKSQSLGVTISKASNELLKKVSQINGNSSQKTPGLSDASCQAVYVHAISKYKTIGHYVQTPATVFLPND